MHHVYDGSIADGDLGNFDYMNRELDCRNNQTHQASSEYANSIPDSSDDGSFHLQVFWIINGLSLLLVVAFVVCCYRKSGVSFIESWVRDRANGQLSDYYFRTAMELRQAERQEQKRNELPEKRRLRLLDNFAQNGVCLVVNESDLGHVNQADSEFSNDEENACDKSSLYLSSHLTNSSRLIPNCCAVCLCPYGVGDSVVWSSNCQCKHAFHSECIVEWLIKMQVGTPCPCCRQEFTNLLPHTEEVAKSSVDEIDVHDRAFNLSVVSLGR